MTSSLDSTIRMWDLADRECSTEKLRFSGHRAGVVDLAYSDDFRFLLSAGIDHEVLFPLICQPSIDMGRLSVGWCVESVFQSIGLQINRAFCSVDRRSISARHTPSHHR
jgi:WD40 repeat protein